MKPRKITYIDRTIYHIDGKLHREDGPALEYSYGGDAWYINGVWLTDAINQWFSDTVFNSNYKSWTTQEKLEFKLRWA